MEQIQIRKVFPQIENDDTLLPTQLTALRYLMEIESNIGDHKYPQGCILGDDMGSGKSKVLAYLTYINAVKKTLVITPFNTIFQLACVFLTICKGFKCYILEKEDRYTEVCYQPNGRGLMLVNMNVGDPLSKYAVVFINRDKLTTKHKIKMIKMYRWSRIIIDEAHAFRNQKIKACAILQEIPKTTAVIDGKRVEICSDILSTGTPIQNGIGDLLSLFRVIAPGILEGVRSEEEIKKELIPYIKRYLFRRRIEDYTDEMKRLMKIPLEDPSVIDVKIQLEKTDISKWVETKNWKTIFARCKEDKDFRKALLRDERAYITAACQKIREASQNKGIDLNNLKIYLSNPFEGDLFETVENKTTALTGECRYKGIRSKDVELVKILKEYENESFVIYHEYKSTRDYFIDVIGDAFPDLEIHTVDGEDKLEKRFNTLNRCNESIDLNERVILFSSIGATCEGMNYQRFSKGVFLDQRANNAQESQLFSRLHRMGQISPVYFWFLCYKPFNTKYGIVEVDNRIMDIKEEKGETAKIVDINNAAWTFKHYKVMGENGELTSGIRFSDKHESKEPGSKGAKDSVGPDDILEFRN